jgi:hypothetical protein
MKMELWDAEINYSFWIDNLQGQPKFLIKKVV